MKLVRRQFLRLAVGAAVVTATARIAAAQPYPGRTVRLLVGFPPGGQIDIVARLIAQWISARIGQPIVVENRPGAGGNTGTEAALRAQPDGYTLLMAAAANTVNATIYDRLNFDFARDIAPVGTISRNPLVIVVNPSVLASTLPEFIAYAKANPGKLAMASAGNGTPHHISGELFKMMTGISMLHVPYRGEAPALIDLMGGQVQVMFTPTGGAIEHIRSSKIRALAVTTSKRLDVLPDSPAVNEIVPGYEASGWFGIGAPRNTSAEIVARLNGEINAALADPHIRERFASLGVIPFPGSPADLADLITAETEKWRGVVKFAGIKAD